ncbi:PTS trehalose transporter subunit IIBC [Psittacicella gerlachiana]|uniref:PTS trehalose transporter subunit IIBC n=1 Tax=Psittacicella gerlachiana TaxID=2028574 RepID=A0A3A1YC47_9GAMM|nr:PTS trehalose transporter subunit IIBC [Psittacicella gerlachiana]RIY34758.1 PTS trehalose transporter subunit IIBC [Psittacicella gerlachiana]
MAKEISEKDIATLVEQVGGKENIVSVTHCVTRLRFVLADTEKADVKALENLSFVKGCFTTAGQFQVIIGTDVGQYYQALLKYTGLNSASKDEIKSQARQNQKWYEALISHFADIFIPLLPALISGGLILGFRNVIGDIPMVDGKPLTAVYPFLDSLNSFLWLLGEAIFHYLPVGICWSTVKKMGGTPILGIILGVTLVSPQLMNSYGLGSLTPEVWDFGLFTIEKVGYQAQVIPAILTAMVLAWLERGIRKFIPSYLDLVLVPVLTLLIGVTLAHAIIGPIGREIGDGVAYVVKLAMTGSFAPIGSALFGFFYAPLVITGVHQTTLAIDFQLIQNMGGTSVWPLIALSNIAQGSAVLGIVLISRKMNEREVSVPACISAYLGVTEPAMYGINLRYRFPMLCAMIGSGIAGFVSGLFGILANSIGVGGLPGILSIQPIFWGSFALCMLIAVIVPLILTIAVYKRRLAKGTLSV